MKKIEKVEVEKATAKKETLKRIDVTERKTVSDITQKPKNNDEVGKMKKRYLYVKTGNWVVYHRMLQIVPKPNFRLDGDQIVEFGK